MEKADAAPIMRADRNCSIISRESRQTSIRSSFTREFTELSKEEIANKQETVCIPRHCNVLGNHKLAKGTYTYQKAVSVYHKGPKRRPLQQGKVTAMTADTLVLYQSLGSEAGDK